MARPRPINLFDVIGTRQPDGAMVIQAVQLDSRWEPIGTVPRGIVLDRVVARSADEAVASTRGTIDAAREALNRFFGA